MNNGTRNGIDHLNRYPKKLGISTPDDSAIDLTMKFGALPIYVFAPIKTAPAEIANNVFFSSPIKVIGSPPAVLKNTKYVGALSKKLDNTPVYQKYIILTGPLSLETALIIPANAPLVPALSIAIAGMIVTKIPAKSFATSMIGNQVYSLSLRIC